jgi:hypothetical protein
MVDEPFPIQPIERDANGVIRFRPNAIVSFLYDLASDKGGDLHTLALIDFPTADREQFIQLLGVSLGHFAELPYVTDETYAEAEAMAKDVP